MKISRFLTAAVLACACISGARAQENPHGIPDSVFYLLPSFSDGTVYFVSRPPAQGRLNICAVDQSLRFMDRGVELEATGIDDVQKVVIDTVTFLRRDGAFYRLYPAGPGMQIALLREVRIIRGEKKGAYGTVSQTSSSKEYSTLYTEGAAIKLKDGETVPYNLTETFFIYRGNTLYPVNKRGFRRLFPDRKAEVDALFQPGKSAPDSVGAVRKLLDALK